MNQFAPTPVKIRRPDGTTFEARIIGPADPEFAQYGGRQPVLDRMDAAQWHGIPFGEIVSE